MRNSAINVGVVLIIGVVQAGCRHDRPPVVVHPELPPLKVLLQSADEVTQALSQDMKEIVDRHNDGYKIVLILGPIKNKTPLSTNEFEIVQNRIKNSIMTSKLICGSRELGEKGYAKVFKSQREWDQIKGSVVGPEDEDEDIIQTRPAVGGQRFPKASVFSLTGDAHAAARGADSMYQLTFSAVRVYNKGQAGGAGEEVWSHEYDFISTDWGRKP